MVVMEAAEEVILLTQTGRQRMEEELTRLVTVERPEIAARIRDAKDYGDLTENSEYEAAKNAQAFVEGRIIDLKGILARARTLADCDVSIDRVGIGSVVTVRDMDFEDDWTIQIVSAYEADPDADRVSDLSPVGKALLGHRIGDVVVVKTPAGTSNFEVLHITR